MAKNPKGECVHRWATIHGLKGARGSVEGLAWVLRLGWGKEDNNSQYRYSLYQSSSLDPSRFQLFVQVNGIRTLRVHTHSMAVKGTDHDGICSRRLGVAQMDFTGY